MAAHSKLLITPSLAIKLHNMFYLTFQRLLKMLKSEIDYVLAGKNINLKLSDKEFQNLYYFAAEYYFYLMIDCDHIILSSAIQEFQSICMFAENRGLINFSKVSAEQHIRSIIYTSLFERSRRLKFIEAVMDKIHSFSFELSKLIPPMNIVRLLGVYNRFYKIKDERGIFVWPF